ncbi:MAG TPA: xanthine dehydrogenase family protein subunit M [Oligoflexus sp.]|uniref:FAD binding domain-containing protein n=1 Tax=Oligoflexus sp. TaxID=1971216 RepID=UPI002D7EC100|nr:xanthine dehydrogenase family protein subunit M [Oligoflexus sp.]HET9239083.1 xanthine dehydrogenase family protein subunit M [Oligoflexus sp.]
MMQFSYQRSQDLPSALSHIRSARDAKFIGGGTNLFDLIKADVMRPAQVLDINQLPFHEITDNDQGGLRIGALVTNSDVAWNPLITARYPLLAKAILAGASPQLRNMATTGGNLLQRTRCYYFYDKATPCNKRSPGSGCGAIGGFNRIHAILGASSSCIAVHPSDMCVALAALDAEVRVESMDGSRVIPFADFHRLPGDTPERDHNLRDDELITAVDLPADDFSQHFTYIKIRDRSSYAFALVSVAAALQMDNGIIKKARLALGGVAHKPWRRPEAEALLENQKPEQAAFEAAAQALLEGAKGQGHNNFKIELAHRAIIRALSEAAGMEVTA